MLTAGDGNCAYRAFVIGLLETAAAADDCTRQSLLQQVEELYRELPMWAISSFNGTSSVVFGYTLLKVSSFSGDQCHLASSA